MGDVGEPLVSRVHPHFGQHQQPVDQRHRIGIVPVGMLEHHGLHQPHGDIGAFGRNRARKPVIAKTQLPGDHRNRDKLRPSAGQISAGVIASSAATSVSP